MTQTTPSATPQPRRRFRYGLTTILFLLFLLAAAATAVIGYNTGHVLYRSDGVINIKPIIDSPDVAPVVVPMYRQYVLEQMARIHSQRVIEMAITSQQWQQFNRGMSPKAKAEFFKELDVTMPYQDAGLVFVSFTDENPAAAQIAVREIIHAFQVVEEEEGGQPLSNKVATLTDEASRLRQQIAARELDIRQVVRDTQERSADDVSAVHSRYRQQLIELELMRAQVESALQVANLHAAADEGQPITKPGFSAVRFDIATSRATAEPPASTNIPALARRKEELDAEYAAILAKASKYGAAREKIIQARDDVEELKHKLDDNQANLKHAQDSLAQNGNVQILDPGSTPYVPIIDTRLSRAIGGGGLVLAVGLLAAICTAAVRSIRHRRATAATAASA